jgi:hypothetical protein
MPDRRKLLWWAFWFVFLTTPATIISLPILLDKFPYLNVLNDYGLTEAGASLLGGSILAALLLARLYNETTAQLSPAVPTQILPCCFTSPRIDLRRAGANVSRGALQWAKLSASISALPIRW